MKSYNVRIILVLSGYLLACILMMIVLSVFTDSQFLGFVITVAHSVCWYFVFKRFLITDKRGRK